MRYRINVNSILIVTSLILVDVFATSFVGSENKNGNIRVPFVLRLAQSGSDKVTAVLDSTKSVQMRSGFVTLQPGENVGSHNTGEHEELLIVLSGTGQVNAQGVGRENISKGMVAYMPPNNQHNVYCTGSSPLQYIYVVSTVKER